MHCGTCCLSLSMTKARAVPKHYSEEVKLLGWEQKECPGSGTKDYLSHIKRCRRRRSEMRCPACGKNAGAKKDGRIKKHNDERDKECPASRDNR